jgi:hypothetical protein
VQAVVDELTAELEAHAANETLPFRPMEALDAVSLDAWAPSVLEGENPFESKANGELTILLPFLAQHAANGELRFVLGWGVEASLQGVDLVELIRWDEQRFLVQVQSSEQGWVIRALDPILEYELVRDAGAEEFALSFMQDYLARHELMGSLTIGSSPDEMYLSLASWTCARSMLRVAGPSFPTEEWLEFWPQIQGIPAFLHTFGAAIDEGVARGWEQSLELARVALRDDGKIDAAVRLVQRRTSSSQPRARLVHLVLERDEADRWCLAETPREGERIHVIDMNFAPDSGRWQVQPPQRF